MFDYIKGRLVHSTPDTATLDVFGLGFLVYIPLSTFHQLPSPPTETLLYIHTVYKEDSQKAYGFISRSERAFFEKLLTISGIGPKSALSLIGHLPEEELLGAISSGNVSTLSRVPGIGKKTAERLIMELRGTVASSGNPIAADAINALVNLGYTAASAQKAITKTLAKGEKNDLSSLITSALREM